MKTIKRIFLFLFIILIIVSTAIISSGYTKYKEALEELPLVDAVASIKSIDNYTKINDVPEMYKNAVIATEDRRFEYHNGFDMVGAVRAIIVDIKKKELAEGGSTITQQLAKNMYFQSDNTPSRKIAEIFMALEIENQYSKDEIFEFYMNVIYFGSGYYNIYDAAVGYFEKKPSQMDDYESTLLAGVPNAPSVYSPKVNPDLAKKRQQKVIDCLVDCEYITKEDGDKILSQKE